MRASVVLLGICCLTVFGAINAETTDGELNIQERDQNQSQQKSQNIHHKSHQKRHRNNQEKHHFRHHKGLKARDGNSSACISICDLELIAVAKWLNNTRELKLLFQLIPPSVKKIIFGDLNGTSFNTSIFNPNATFNGSISVNLDLLYDAAADWPILTYLAKLVGFFLSRIHGIVELFNFFPDFANLWKIILHGLSSASDKAEILIGNIRDLFGFNGTFGGNLFNFTYWEQFWTPSRIIKGIEHAVEGGIEALANFSGITG